MLSVGNLASSTREPAQNGANMRNGQGSSEAYHPYESISFSHSGSGHFDRGAQPRQLAKPQLTDSHSRPLYMTELSTASSPDARSGPQLVRNGHLASSIRSETQV